MLETLQERLEMFGLKFLSVGEVEDSSVMVEISSICRDLDESRFRLDSSSATKAILRGSWKLISKLLLLVPSYSDGFL